MDLDKALEELGQEGITKLILDLRNNPGGLLNQAVEVTDRFLNRENLIVYTKGRSEDQNMRFTSQEKPGQSGDDRFKWPSSHASSRQSSFPSSFFQDIPAENANPSSDRISLSNAF